MKKTFNLALSGEARVEAVSDLSKFISVMLALSAALWFFQNAFLGEAISDLWRTVLCVPMSFSLAIVPFALLFWIIDVLIFFIYDKLIAKTALRFPYLWAVICLVMTVVFFVMFMLFVDHELRIFPWGNSTRQKYFL